MRSPLAFALWLGLVGGLVEVAVRVSPRLGLDAAQLATWMVVSVALALAWSVGSLMVFARLRRAHGFLLGGYLGMQGAFNYRFEWVLNEFVRDPKVWLGMPVVFVAGLGLGVLLDPPLRRWMWALVALPAALAFLRNIPPDHPASARPSVLVVSLDTTRPDRLAAMPNFQRLAREGVRFTQAVANAPITEPSHLAMFTGIPPFRSGVVSNGTVLGERPMVWKSWGDVPSAAFVAGFPLHSKYGWDQGIDVWDDDFGALPGLEALSLKKAWNQFAIREHALRERSADRVLARALPWIKAHRDGSFFAFVHFYDPHGPYETVETPPSGAGAALDLPAYWPEADRAVTDPEWLMRAYDAEVQTVDAAVGALLDALGPALDRTIVVVTADHGETFMEHTPIFDHGDTLYDEALRVPFVVRYPPVAVPGLAPDCQVAGIDLAPTLLELGGIADGTARDGLSRVPELRGGACRDTPVVASTTAGRFVADPPVDHALRGAGHKLIRKQAGGREFYDLVKDPGETRNLAPSPESEAVDTLLAMQLGNGTRALSAEDDATTRALLEELGYLSPP